MQCPLESFIGGMAEVESKVTGKGDKGTFITAKFYTSITLNLHPVPQLVDVYENLGSQKILYKCCRFYNCKGLES